MFIKNIKFINVIPKIIIFTSNKKLFIDYNINRKNIINHSFYNFGGIKTTFDEIKQFLNNNSKREKDDKYMTFEYINNKKDLALPILYKSLLEKTPYYIIQNYINFIYRSYSKNGSIKKLIEQIKNLEDIPIELLSKYLIRAYTIESDFYRDLNKDLGTNNKEDHLPFIKALYEGIKYKSLPLASNTFLYRGSKISVFELDKIKNYLKNKIKDLPSAIVFSRSFLSFSKERYIEEGFISGTNIDKSLHRVLYILEKDDNMDYSLATHGDIENISNFPSEKEVLFYPFSSFEIKDIKEVYLKGKKIYEIRLFYLGKYLKEIENDNNLMKNEIDILKLEFKRQVAHSGLIPEGNMKTIKHLFSEYKKYKDDLAFNENYNLNPLNYEYNSNPPNYQYNPNYPNYKLCSNYLNCQYCLKLLYLNIFKNNFIKKDIIMDLYYKLYNKGYVSNIKEIKSEKGDVFLKQFIINHKFGQNKYDNWIQAWHGTKFKYIESIIINGLKLPGTKLNDGTHLTVSYDIPLNIIVDNIKNWGKAIFSSDNIYLALQYSDEINVNENNNEIYLFDKNAKEKKFTYSEIWKGLVKIKIRPNSFSKHKSKIVRAYHVNRDKYIDGDIYRTISEKDIVITSVVFIKLSYINENKNKLDSILWELNENNKDYNNKSLIKNLFYNEYNSYNNAFTSNLNDKESSFNNLNINELYESDSYKYNEYNNKSLVYNSNSSSLSSLFEDYKNPKNKLKKSHSKILNKLASYYSIYDSINYLEDSMIIKDKNDAKMIKNWISPNKNISFKLLYRATRDGDSHDNFYSKCNEAPNIAFIKINDGRIIGGYTTVPWKSENNSFISDKETFIFSINSKEKYNLKPNLNGNNAIYHNSIYYCVAMDIVVMI